jgi:hypothetical protein
MPKIKAIVKKCSICGALGATKSTCPRNPEAIKSNPDKHNAGPAMSDMPNELLIHIVKQMPLDEILRARSINTAYRRAAQVVLSDKYTEYTGRHKPTQAEVDQYFKVSIERLKNILRSNGHIYARHPVGRGSRTGDMPLPDKDTKALLRHLVNIKAADYMEGETLYPGGTFYPYIDPVIIEQITSDIYNNHFSFVHTTDWIDVGKFRTALYAAVNIDIRDAYKRGEDYVYRAHHTIFYMFSSDMIDPNGEWAHVIDTIDAATYSVRTGLLIDM